MRLVEGRSRTSVLVPSLTLLVGGIPVTSCTPFFIEAVCEFWPYIRGNEEQPAEEEYLALSEMRVATHIYFDSGKGVSVSLTPSCDLGELLTELQVDDIILCLKKQSAGFVNSLQGGL